MPRVSVITPCFNSERFIGRTIESVLAQTFTNWEYVIVDDGSPGAFTEAVSPYLATDPRVRIVRQANGGTSSARNRGFAASSEDGDFLLFLDADDCLEPQMLAVMVDYLDTHGEVGMVYCDRLEIDGADNVLEERPLGRVIRYVPGHRTLEDLPPNVPNTPFISLYFGFCGAIPSVSVYRRRVYEDTGGWDEDIRQGGEDLDLRLRIVLRSPVHYLPLNLVRRRIHAANHSTSRAELWARARASRIRRRKWSRGVGLTEQDKRMVAEAQRWREIMRPFVWFTWGNDALHRKSVVSATWCYLNGIKCLLTPGQTSIRQRLLRHK